MLLVSLILTAILLSAISSYFLFSHVKIRVDGFLDCGGFQVSKSLDAFINGATAEGNAREVGRRVLRKKAL
jgi:cell division protein FtsW (lipid II flippase)